MCYPCFLYLKADACEPGPLSAASLRRGNATPEWQLLIMVPDSQNLEMMPGCFSFDSWTSSLHCFLPNFPSLTCSTVSLICHVYHSWKTLECRVYLSVPSLLLAVGFLNRASTLCIIQEKTYPTWMLRLCDRRIVF